MKNTLPALKTTTAIVLSLSLVGTQGFAASGFDGVRLAQNLAQNEEVQAEPEIEGDAAKLLEAASKGEPQKDTEEEASGAGEVDTSESGASESGAGEASESAAPVPASKGIPPAGSEEQQAGNDGTIPPVKPEATGGGAETPPAGDGASEQESSAAESSGEAAPSEDQVETAPIESSEPARKQDQADSADMSENADTPENNAASEPAEAGESSEQDDSASVSGDSQAGQAETPADGESAEPEALDTTNAEQGDQPEAESASTDDVSNEKTTENTTVADGEKGAGDEKATGEEVVSEPTAGEQDSDKESGDKQSGEAPAETTSSEGQASEAVTDKPQSETEQSTESELKPESETSADQATEQKDAEPSVESTDRQDDVEIDADAETAGEIEEEVKDATDAGEDVVIKDQTTTEDLAAELEKLREQQADLEERLKDAKPVDVEEETFTTETARSATEEAPSADSDDDSSSDVWKYLGAAAAGAAVGALVPALGGRLVQESGDRAIVERDGEFYVHKDENALLRQPGSTVQNETFENGMTRSTFTREDGSQIVTVRNPGGYILRRTRITPSGEEIVLLSQTPDDVYSFDKWQDVVPQASAHQGRSIDYTGTDPERLRQALSAEPYWIPDRAIPLQAVRDNVEVRQLVPAIDLPINFATGSAAIRPTEVDSLTALGRMLSEMVKTNPREIFLIEGHTDATGSNLVNLALSDRRAETVALALTQYFDVPPENMVVQGYGERYLKEDTQAASVVNRRVAVRRITPLLDVVASR